jgi:hypothetical protein
MVDYALWLSADPLTGEQAARLWAGIDPSTPLYKLTPEQNAALLARLQMITGNIITGALKADISTNGFALIGIHEKSLVSRADLKAFALSRDERPAFLCFHTEAPPPGRIALSSEQTPISVQVATHDEAPPPPKAPRRFTKAPPPVRTVGGHMTWGPPHPSPPRNLSSPQGSGSIQNVGTGTTRRRRAHHARAG